MNVGTVFTMVKIGISVTWQSLSILVLSIVTD